ALWRFLSPRYRALRRLPSFPTRRSSDLPLPAAEDYPRKAVVRIGVVQRRMRATRSAEDLLNQVEFFVDALSDYRADFCVLPEFLDRKSTRLNSSHVKISYAVFCLKKKRE